MRISIRQIERAVCEKLGLKPATLSTQIVQRDRHAEFRTTLASDRFEYRSLGDRVSASCNGRKFWRWKNFSGKDRREAPPCRTSAIPITGERLSGLARVIRGNAVVALENVALWHERDISHSSAERIILPDSCILLDYMLVKLRDLVEGLQVYPERMDAEPRLTKGLYFSQSILLALTRAGAQNARTPYEAVQRAAMKTWKGEGTFVENAKREPEITDRLPTQRSIVFVRWKLISITLMLRSQRWA